jgi:hypothetical protein
LGAKYLVVLCAGSALLLAEDESTSVVNGALVGVLLSQSASPSVVLSALLLIDINLGFLTEGNLLLYSSHLPLGVPNGLVIHHAQGPSINTYHIKSIQPLGYRPILTRLMQCNYEVTHIKHFSKQFNSTKRFTTKILIEINQCNYHVIH